VCALLCSHMARQGSSRRAGPLLLHWEGGGLDVQRLCTLGKPGLEGL
jgi:hypothetical protein